MARMIDIAPSNSLARLIAWVSVCLLSAGWGSFLHPDLRALWSDVGLFGLASAWGLDIAWRARARRKKQSQCTEWQGRLDRDVATVLHDLAAAERVRATLERIATAPSIFDGSLPGSASAGAFPRPAGIIELGEHNASGSRVRPVSALGCDVANRCVSLAGNRAIDAGQIVLTFSLADDDAVALLADVVWSPPVTESADGQYLSRVKVTAVLDRDDVPASAGSGAAGGHGGSRLPPLLDPRSDLEPHGQQTTPVMRLRSGRAGSPGGL